MKTLRNKSFKIFLTLHSYLELVFIMYLSMSSIETLKKDLIPRVLKK